MELYYVNTLFYREISETNISWMMRLAKDKIPNILKLSRRAVEIVEDKAVIKDFTNYAIVDAKFKNTFDDIFKESFDHMKRGFGIHFWIYDEYENESSEASDYTYFIIPEDVDNYSSRVLRYFLEMAQSDKDLVVSFVKEGTENSKTEQERHLIRRTATGYLNDKIEVLI